jgi:hypothetical protein
VRQLALLHFRNAITLSVRLEDALARAHARVPPAIVQMLLVLQVRHGCKARLRFGDPEAERDSRCRDGAGKAMSLRSVDGTTVVPCGPRPSQSVTGPWTRPHPHPPPPTYTRCRHLVQVAFVSKDRSGEGQLPPVSHLPIRHLECPRKGADKPPTVCYLAVGMLPYSHLAHLTITEPGGTTTTPFYRRGNRGLTCSEPGLTLILTDPTALIILLIAVCMWKSFKREGLGAEGSQQRPQSKAEAGMGRFVGLGAGGTAGLEAYGCPGNQAECLPVYGISTDFRSV